VASGLGIAIMATVLSARITANLPHGAGAAAAAGSQNLAAVHLPPPIKAIVLEQATKGFDDTFWVAAGLVVLAFPLTLLLRRAARPQEVRRYALRQLTEGIVLGAAARRLRRDGPRQRVEQGRAEPVLSQAALARLRRGQALLRGGTAAGGLMPKRRPGLLTGVSFAVLTVAAVIAMVAATSYGYRTPDVPSLPAVAQAHR
jgi:hypothetical protein